MRRRATRIRIGIDAGALDFPAGGVRRYVREFLAALPETASAMSAPVEFVAVGAGAGVDAQPPVLRGPRVATLPTNLARAAIALPWAIHRAKLDLFHAPAYTAPLLGHTPVVLTIHDVSYARRPEFYAYRSDRARQWFYRRSALATACIVTDSEFSKREIVAAYGIPAARISVVPLGVGAPFGPGDRDRDQVPGPAFDVAPFDYAPFDFAQGRPFEFAPCDFAPFEFAPFDYAPFDFAQGGQGGQGGQGRQGRQGGQGRPGVAYGSVCAAGRGPTAVSSPRRRPASAPQRGISRTRGDRNPASTEGARRGFPATGLCRSRQRQRGIIAGNLRCRRHVDSARPGPDPSGDVYVGPHGAGDVGCVP